MFMTEKYPSSKRTILGKVAIVTGSSRSIGAAVAKCLGEHGANVVVQSIRSLRELPGT